MVSIVVTYNKLVKKCSPELCSVFCLKWFLGVMNHAFADTHIYFFVISNLTYFSGIFYCNYEKKIDKILYLIIRYTIQDVIISFLSKKTEIYIIIFISTIWKVLDIRPPNVYKMYIYCYYFLIILIYMQH